MLTAVTVFLRVQTMEQSDNTTNRLVFLQTFDYLNIFLPTKIIYCQGSHLSLVVLHFSASCSQLLSGLFWPEKYQILIRVIIITELPPPLPSLTWLLHF